MWRTAIGNRDPSKHGGMLRSHRKKEKAQSASDLSCANTARAFVSSGKVYTDAISGTLLLSLLISVKNKVLYKVQLLVTVLSAAFGGLTLSVSQPTYCISQQPTNHAAPQHHSLIFEEHSQQQPAACTTNREATPTAATSIITRVRGRPFPHEEEETAFKVAYRPFGMQQQ